MAYILCTAYGSTFQIMWVFKFNRTLGQLGLTLKYSGSHVLNMSLISGVIFIAYVTLMHTILGPHDPAYRFAVFSPF